MKIKRFLPPLIMPILLVAIQAVYLLLVFILFETAQERLLIRVVMYGYPLMLLICGVFAVGLFPFAAFRHGKRISSLDGVVPKLLLSLYCAIIAVVSFGVLIVMVPVWWIWLAIFAWIFLWSFVTALFYRNTTPVEVDAEAIAGYRKISEYR